MRSRVPKPGTKRFYEETTAAQRGAILRKWFDLVIANVQDCMKCPKRRSQAGENTQIGEVLT
jgi:hypothetical protein